MRSADEIDTCDEIRAAWSCRAGHAERRAGTRCTRPEMRVDARDVRALLAACDSLADALEAAQRRGERLVAENDRLVRALSIARCDVSWPSGMHSPPHQCTESKHHLTRHQCACGVKG